MDIRTQKRAMLTVTERQTRFALAAERLDRTAEAATAAQIRLLAGLPPHARRSNTYDRDPVSPIYNRTRGREAHTREVSSRATSRSQR